MVGVKYLSQLDGYVNREKHMPLNSTSLETS